MMKSILRLNMFWLLLAVADAKPFNFVFILSDDQSWRGTSARMDPDLPESSSDYYMTPEIEKLFESGMRFSRAYAPAPYCCPTRRSLLTGQSPARHIYQKDQESWTEVFRKQRSIPRVLKKIDPNYLTAHFGKWDHRFDEVTPEEMGYDLSDGATGNGEGGSRDSGGPRTAADPKLISHITERACQAILDAHQQSRPFYVQISHYAVHLDIVYKQETLDRVKQREKGGVHDIAEFAAMTEDLDAGVGRVFQQIKDLGLEASTYIIFMSDNGGRKSLPGFPAKNLNAPLRNGKGTMYEGGIRVPFAVVGPGIKPNSVSHVPVNGVDILPTLADLNGQAISLQGLDGGSLKPILLQKNDAVERKNDFLVFHHAVKRKPQTAIIQGKYKLVVTWKKEGDELELFDMEKELNEAHDLSMSEPDLTRNMYQAMKSYLSEVGATKRYTRKK